MAFLSYRVYLHDPTYHYLVKNPLVSPRIFRQYKDLTTSGGSYQWLYITVTEKKNLNRESQSCEVILVRVPMFSLTSIICRSLRTTISLPASRRVRPDKLAVGLFGTSSGA